MPTMAVNRRFRMRYDGTRSKFCYADLHDRFNGMLAKQEINPSLPTREWPDLRKSNLLEEAVNVALTTCSDVHRPLGASYLALSFVSPADFLATDRLLAHLGSLAPKGAILSHPTSWLNVTSTLDGVVLDLGKALTTAANDTGWSFLFEPLLVPQFESIDAADQFLLRGP